MSSVHVISISAPHSQANIGIFITNLSKDHITILDGTTLSHVTCLIHNCNTKCFMYIRLTQSKWDTSHVMDTQLVQTNEAVKCKLALSVTIQTKSISRGVLSFGGDFFPSVSSRKITKFVHTFENFRICVLRSWVADFQRHVSHVKQP